LNKNNAMRLQATVLLLVSFFFVKLARSQSNELIIEGQTGKLYLEHTVVARENWYSVGRLYNANPKEIASFNHLALTQMLTIGQTLQIPLTTVNFSQDGRKTPAETLVPVFHIVQDKEWMYRISVNHNKVPIPTIEKWNKITGAQVHPGLHLIVGYLKVKTSLSVLATGGGTPAMMGAGVSAVTKGAPAAAPATMAAPDKSAKALPPADKVPEANIVPDSPANPPSTIPKPALATSAAVPAAPAPATPVSNTRSPAPAVPAVPVPATTAPVAPVPAAPAVPAPHFNGGIFKSDFSSGGKSASGQAGIFKSTSGWQDGKYYALMNNVAVGTIVKISDATTGKSVYAKILGQLPDMKESAGLTIRVSNAAAAELGEGDGRFNVAVGY
jgi:LysM domain